MLPNEQAALKQALRYFVFDGTGSADSLMAANGILEVGDVAVLSTWKWHACATAEAQEAWVEHELLPHAVVSIRSKGMPKKADPAAFERLDPWIYRPRGYEHQLRGSLHVRYSPHATRKRKRKRQPQT